MKPKLKTMFDFDRTLEEALNDICDFVDERALVGNFELIDLVMGYACYNGFNKEIEPEVLITWLTTTFSMKDKLSFRKLFFDKTKEIFQNYEEVDQLLQGLE